MQITDTTTCCRLKIFEIVKPKERTSQDNIHMTSGTALHRHVQKKISNPDPEIYGVELLVEYKGYVFGSIDLREKTGNNHRHKDKSN